MTLSLLFVLVCLAAYRVVRFVVVDDFPPMRWARDRLAAFVDRHWGSDWSEGVTCPWCAGFYVSAAVVALTWRYVSLPLPALWFAAVPAVAGYLNAYDGG